ncbi:MAG: hypothetical protein OHK0017_07300 [Patescibacteria group bacterium]
MSDFRTESKHIELKGELSNNQETKAELLERLKRINHFLLDYDDTIIFLPDRLKFESLNFAHKEIVSSNDKLSSMKGEEFARIMLDFADPETSQTKFLRDNNLNTPEVILFWQLYRQYLYLHLEQFSNEIIISHGFEEFVKFCNSKSIKLSLVTNSDMEWINKTLCQNSKLSNIKEILNGFERLICLRGSSFKSKPDTECLIDLINSQELEILTGAYIGNSLKDHAFAQQSNLLSVQIREASFEDGLYANQYLQFQDFTKLLAVLS